MEPVRLGIIGCGVIGHRHLKATQDSSFIKVTAVADLNEGIARDTAQEFGIDSVYFNAADLLNDRRIEGVVLALPTVSRTNLALQAFAKRKHVLVEKPVAMNSTEVRQMIAAKGDLIAGCCSSRFRFLEGAAAATDFIASGALGPLRLIRCRAIKPADKPPEAAPPAWRLNRALNGGGILVNWGCYDLDYLMGLTGWIPKPRSVLAQTWGVAPQFINQVAPGSDAESHYAALIKCEDGIAVSLERGEYVAAKPEEVWEVIGAKGSLKLNMTDELEKTIVHDDSTPGNGSNLPDHLERQRNSSLNKRRPDP